MEKEIDIYVGVWESIYTWLLVNLPTKWMFTQKPASIILRDNSLPLAFISWPRFGYPPNTKKQIITELKKIDFNKLYEDTICGTEGQL